MESLRPNGLSHVAAVLYLSTPFRLATRGEVERGMCIMPCRFDDSTLTLLSRVELLQDKKGSGKLVMP